MSKDKDVHMENWVKASRTMPLRSMEKILKIYERNNRMIELTDETIIDLINTRNFKEIEQNLLTIISNKKKFEHRSMISIYDNDYKKYDIGRDLAYFANNLGGILIAEFKQIKIEKVINGIGSINYYNERSDIHRILYDIKPAIVSFSKSFLKFTPDEKDIHIFLVPGKEQQTTFTYYPDEGQG